MKHINISVYVYPRIYNILLLSKFPRSTARNNVHSHRSSQRTHTHPHTLALQAFNY